MPGALQSFRSSQPMATQAALDQIKQDLTNLVQANVAGGVLAGTLPNPEFASDMAYQAELDVHATATQDVHGIADTAALVLTTDSRLSDTRPPQVHQHPLSDVTGLQTALAGKIDSTDGRLTDARAPTPHTHAWTAITATPTTVAGYGITDVATANALSTHATATNNPHGVTASQIGALTQTIADTRYLQTANVVYPSSWMAVQGGSGNGHSITNIAAAQTDLSSRIRTRRNLTRITRARIVAFIVTAANAGSQLRCQWATTNSATAGDWLALDGVTGPTLSLSAAGLLDSGWITVVATAKIDAYLRLVTIGGDGAADPVLGHVEVQFE